MTDYKDEATYKNLKIIKSEKVWIEKAMHGLLRRDAEDKTGRERNMAMDDKIDLKA